VSACPNKQSILIVPRRPRARAPSTPATCKPSCATPAPRPRRRRHRHCRSCRDDRHPRHDIVHRRLARLDAQRSTKPLRRHQRGDTKKLEKLFRATDLHERFLQGTDYPLPAIDPLISTGNLVDNRLLSEDNRGFVNRIFYKIGGCLISSENDVSVSSMAKKKRGFRTRCL
jgi:hypothetical protein